MKAQKWNKKLVSLLLALIMTMGSLGLSFADNNTQDPHIQFGVNGATVTYDVSTVGNPAVTRGDFYALFPEGSTQNLAAVTYTVRVEDANTLLINGTTVTMTDETGPWKVYTGTSNFTNGYVLFEVKNAAGQLVRDYDMTAGIAGQTVNLKVYFRMKPVIDLTDQQYQTFKERAENLQALNVITVAVPVQSTAMFALQKAQGSSNNPRFVAVGMDQGYISAMGVDSNNLLSAFDITSQSGWMYKISQNPVANEVNSLAATFANVGASQYKLTASDKVMYWGFTLSYGSDWGGTPW